MQYEIYLANNETAYAVTFVQRVKVTKPEANLVGFIEFMACTGGQCTPPTEADFKFVLKK